MNRVTALLALLAGVLVCAEAMGQPRREQEAIPRSVKESNAPDQAVITSFIDRQVGRLRDSANPAAQSSAREALVAESMLAVGTPATPAYLDIYTDALNTALLAVAEDDDKRVRLNAAIVAARVAEQSNTTRLNDAVLRFVTDEAQPVALWGVRAAKFVIPPMLRLQAGVLGERNSLLPAVVEAATRHRSGPLIHEAYDALTLRISEEPGNAQEPMVRAVIPHVLALLEERTGRYARGIPAEPAHEARATFFLTHRVVWATMDDQQRVQMVQLTSDLVALGGQQAATAARADREQLAGMLSQTARALFVIGQLHNSTTLQEAVVPVTEIDARTDPGEILQRTQEVYGAIVQIPQFSELRPPPDVRAAR